MRGHSSSVVRQFAQPEARVANTEEVEEKSVLHRKLFKKQDEGFFSIFEEYVLLYIHQTL